jgi:hypothetical protein
MFRRKIAPKIIDTAKSALNKYRAYDYSALVAILRKTEEDPDHVELIDVLDNDDEYQITIDANWDDQKAGNVRYEVSAFRVPIKPLLGFMPISFTSALDGFIMKSDGTFIDEENNEI